MITIIILIFSCILLYVMWDVLKYSKQIEKNERYNRESLEGVYKKKKKHKSYAKVSKDKVQNKRKPGRPKKTIKKSK